MFIRKYSENEDRPTYKEVIIPMVIIAIVIFIYTNFKDYNFI